MSLFVLNMFDPLQNDIITRFTFIEQEVDHMSMVITYYNYWCYVYSYITAHIWNARLGNDRVHRFTRASHRECPVGHTVHSR